MEEIMKLVPPDLKRLRVSRFAGNALAVALAAVAWLGTVAGSEAYAADPSMQKKWPAGTTVTIESPKEGQVVEGEGVDKNEVTFVLSVKGGTLVREGKKTKPGEGHFYLMLDGKPVDMGTPTAARDADKMVWGTTVKMHVPAYSKNSYTVQWVDGDNYSYGAAASHTIRNVRLKE
jgi:hypothetical protein